MRTRPPSILLSTLVLMLCLAAPASGEEKPSLEEILEGGRLEDLKGCWECVTGLVNADTKAPLAMEFCFDADGEGERTVKEKFGDTCRGRRPGRSERGRRPCRRGRPCAVFPFGLPLHAPAHRVPERRGRPRVRRNRGEDEGQACEVDCRLRATTGPLRCQRRQGGRTFLHRKKSYFSLTRQASRLKIEYTAVVASFAKTAKC